MPRIREYMCYVTVEIHELVALSVLCCTCEPGEGAALRLQGHARVVGVPSGIFIEHRCRFTLGDWVRFAGCGGPLLCVASRHLPRQRAESPCVKFVRLLAHGAVETTALGTVVAHSGPKAGWHAATRGFDVVLVA